MLCVHYVHTRRSVCAGPGLLDLPEEVLLRIQGHLNTIQWLSGPALTCQRLCQLPLTRLAMRQLVGPSPIFDVPAGAINPDWSLPMVLRFVQVATFHDKHYFGEENLTAADRARLTQRTISGLRWAARRTCGATISLSLAFTLYAACTGSAAADPMVAAFSNVVPMHKLRSLNFSVFPLKEPGTHLALETFLDRLLEQAPSLEAARFCIRTRHLPASHISFQHMKHLIMTSHGFQSHLLVAEQLPVLETLSITGRYHTRLEVIDMSGCKQLRQLVLSDFVAEELIWDSTGPGTSSCPLAWELQHPFELFTEECKSREGVDRFNRQASAAEQVTVNFNTGNHETVGFFLKAFESARVLALEWPVLYSPGGPNKDDFRANHNAGENRLLLKCMGMPPPMSNLEIVIIRACSMRDLFLGRNLLPNLKELVIKASGRLELSFATPTWTISKLNSLHVFGRPLIPDGCELSSLTEASSALEERGLALGMASAEQHGPDGRPASCLYLRPLGARELSIDELWSTVEQLAHCRCGGCLDCLSRAGCIDT